MRLADDYVEGISAVTTEIYGIDTTANRRKVYYQLELPEGKRLRGLFKLGPRRIACVPSLLRADLYHRAGALPITETAAAPPQP